MGNLLLAGPSNSVPLTRLGLQYTHDHSTRWVERCDEMLHALKEERFDLIVMEMRLSWEGYMALSSVLTEVSKGAGVIAIMGSKEPNHSIAGIDCILRLPVDAGELQRLAEYYMSSGKGEEVTDLQAEYVVEVTLEHDDLQLSDLRRLTAGPWTVRRVFEYLEPHRAYKNKLYDGSWAKRGLMGWWAGAIGRSIDRVDGVVSDMNIKMRGTDNDAIDGSILYVLDTLMDVAMYALMGMALLANIRPDAWERFMNNLNTSSTGKEN